MRMAYANEEVKLFTMERKKKPCIYDVRMSNNTLQCFSGFMAIKNTQCSACT